MKNTKIMYQVRYVTGWSNEPMSKPVETMEEALKLKEEAAEKIRSEWKTQDTEGLKIELVRSYDKDEYNSKYNKKHSSEIQEYNRKNTTQICLRLSNENDSDIIEFLQTVPNKVDFIRELIRDYIMRQ